MLRGYEFDTGKGPMFWERKLHTKCEFCGGQNQAGQNMYFSAEPLFNVALKYCRPTSVFNLRLQYVFRTLCLLLQIHYGFTHTDSGEWKIRAGLDYD